jgi:hypothetical protein
MIMNSALLLLARSGSTALLAMVSWRYVAAYYVGDQIIYLAQKAARGDWWHWTPLDGAAGIMLTPIIRIVLKAINDFTGVVQFRGSGELGGETARRKKRCRSPFLLGTFAGCYWSLSMASAVLFPFAAVPIYFKNVDAPAFREGTAWAVAVGMSGAWIFFFTIFLVLMKPKIRATFTSTQTGHAWVKGRFIDEKNNDECRMFIHFMNRKQWASIRDDVKAWTMENWERWEEEKPDWFNDAFKASVDDDMIPPASLRKLNGGESARRRSSLGDVLGVGARVTPVGGGDAQ